ncbi:ATP-binding response regulator [Flectobacillus longus]|uniref:ATP-binding response regulator n=1 Tax=Flectobacillus longus TaxID=2984207 RepID=UPI0024B7AEC0|nr:response regulator [Flectobacillus longus]MDI9881020.1 response regulator [Flectobacillus longus]
MIPKIVLIEDDLLLAENTKTILELNRFECEVAHKGQLGVELVQSVKPDLVVCDIMLDEVDGFEVLKRIRAIPEFIYLPFIFLTARADFLDKRKGMNLGADDFLTKPFMSKDLVETIRARLDLSNQKKESVGLEIRKNAVDVFYHISSHEYLTPLNGIVNLSKIAADMLKNNQINDALALMEGISISGNRILRTTRKLLWYNQLSNHDNPWRNATSGTVNILALQQQISDTLKKGTPSQFEFSFKSNINILYGYDEVLLEFVLTELFQNVIQYANPANKVYSDTRLENNHLVMIIRNHYHGKYTVCTDDVKPFFQAHNSKDMNGTGLGLYIIKEWVQTVHGEMKVSGQNNLFEVILKIPVSIF